MLVRGELFAPEPRGHVVVEVDGGRIASISPVAVGSPAPNGALGDSGAIIAPGFIDIQLNGTLGQDFADPLANVAHASSGMPAFGVTAYLACVVTSPAERYPACLDHLAESMAEPRTGAHLLGIHLEGPFLNPRRRGAHTSSWLLPPSTGLAERWLERAPVRLVTLAPELPGAVALIRMLVSRGIVVAIGHTDATWQEADEAARAGARLGTHLFNAMRPLHHTDPGAAGFLLASELAVSVIADGYHLDPAILRLIAGLKSPDLLVLITDGLAGMGMPPGRFELAGIEVNADGSAGRRRDGTLSGSLLPMNAAVERLVSSGISRENAIRAATLNPARVLGLDMAMGRVAVDRAADLVVLDAGWGVEATVIAGELAYRRDSRLPRDA